MGAAIAALAGNFVCSAPVVTATFGTFLIPITSEFGWSRSAFAMTLTIVALIGVFMFPVAGRIADRWGVRRVVILGNLAFAMAIGFLAFAGNHLSFFYVGYALVGTASAFTSTVLLSRVVSMWFARTRGSILGMTAGIGNGMGCAIMPIFTLYVIAHDGWRFAYLVLGIAIIAIGQPFFLAGLQEPRRSEHTMSAHRSADQASGFTAREARGTALFWVILVAISLGGGALSAIFTHVVPVLIDKHMGDSAAAIITAIALSSTVWQIVLGYLLDRAKTPNFSAICIGISAFGVLLLSNASLPTTSLLAAIMIGVGNGSEYALLSYVVPRYFGLRSYSEIYGAILGVVYLCMGSMPMVMDLVFDKVGSYQPALLGISVALGITALLVLRFPAYRFSREGREIESANWSASSVATV